MPNIFTFQQKKEGGKNNVVLTRMHRSPDNTDMFSDDSNSSFSPSHEWSHQRDGSYDEASLHSSTVTSSFGPIRTALSRSKENLLDTGIGSPIENVVLRRPKSYGLPTDSPSSGMSSYSMFHPLGVNWMTRLSTYVYPVQFLQHQDN